MGWTGISGRGRGGKDSASGEAPSALCCSCSSLLLEEQFLWSSREEVIVQ